MRKTVLLLFSLLTAAVAPAQHSDTGLAPTPPAPQPAAGGVNLPFAIGVAVIVAAFAFAGIIVYFRSEKKKARLQAEAQAQEAAREAAAATPPPPPEPVPDIPDTIVVPEPPPEVAEPLPEVEGEATASPEPDVFYMTVPGTDGRFMAGAKKTQSAGCLYRFRVSPELPGEAELSFAGTEADMRNAQAFRDLELLPACIFSGIPDANTFRFAQQPGKAVLEGDAWVVKEKIGITFE